MPFQSVKQRGYLLAHPEITDKKGRSVGRKWLKEHGTKVEKNRGDGWLKPVVAGTVAGGLANQFPRVQDIEREARRKKKRKGVTKRLDTPDWPEDGFFNTKAAQQAYDLVMKMDRDTAEMFVTCVVSDALEADIEANRRTLQKHLNEVVAKQFTDLKRATMRVVAKSGDGEQEQVEFAQAVSALEEICKAGVVSKVKTPYDYGFVFREDLIRRDPGSGQFQTKIKRTQVRPINDKTAASMGIPEHTTENKPTKFTPKQKAQYQDEYRQLAHFLGSVAQSTQNSGDTRIDLHFEDDQGNQWIEEATSTRPKPGLLDPRDRNLRGVTAYPKTLNLGGAAFGLSGALGGGLSPQRVGQINTAAAQMPSFAQAWTRDYGHTDTNARLYGRTKAGGQLLTEVAPAGSKANLAGHFGRFVGQYGPQAEAVIGPPARKTAYRYRGTEKKPDEKMVEAYRQEVNRQMAFRSGFGDEETQTAVKTAQTRALKAEQNKIADREGKPVEAVRIPEDRRRQILDATKAKVRSVQRPGKPTWTEQNAASAAIIDHLQRPTSEGGAAPEKKLYNLQLASGNVPPSEGVILDRDGQIVTQAIGYGDDHYLPFNLKNLKALKGGSYIRNRSVGGLTSEDIYTGLVSGARQVTVVSRSGVFTMEFEPDFRGARRHNDKAARMTRRYEQLLDAVQSEQVERQGIDPDVRAVITQKVKAEADTVGRGVMTNADIRAEVKRRIQDYQASPELDDDTEEIIQLIVNNRTAGLTSPDSKKIRATVENEIARDKEYRYRLNGNGYAAALDGLREQFPYYIKVRSVPTKELERFETERDLGYIEPGKIRPTAAAAGLFGNVGAIQTPKYDKMGGKLSARDTNTYKPAFVQPEEPTAEPTETSTETAAETGEKKPETAPVPTTIGAIKEQAKYDDAAVTLQQAIKEHIDLSQDQLASKWYGLGSGEFRAWIQNKENQADFDQYVTTRAAEMTAGGTDPSALHRAAVVQPMAGYKQASGRLGQKAYERILSQQWGDKPYGGFAGPAYEAGADEATRHRELTRLRADRVGVVNLKPISQMTDKELEQEVIAVSQIRRVLGGLTGQPTFEQKKEIFQGVNRTSPTLREVFDGGEDSMDAYLETIHRTRAINAGIPDDERGWKVEHHAEPADPQTADRVKNLAYLAEQAVGHYDQGSQEYSQLANLATDLRMKDLKTPKELGAAVEENKPAVDLLAAMLREKKIHNYEPAPEPKPKPLGGSGGPILT